jgi:class 3 adenylate cyclase/TolB-like protein
VKQDVETTEDKIGFLAANFLLLISKAMTQRRLAAIMFTDIIDYDSLLKEDESKAFEIRRKNQRIHRRLIKKFNGRWLKEIKSGTLASFSSVVDAVVCALSIQKATEEIEIPVRVGIHQGEVIFEKKDVLGDGVNIASRIQSFTETHGIVISDTVYKDIKNKEGLEIESLGSQILKGVDSPVGVYKVSFKDEKILDFTIDTGELVRPFGFGRTTIVTGIMVIAILAFALYYFIPKFTQSSSELGNSVLVLPFNNYLGTDTLEYFVAGMHDALISDIGKVSALHVKSKTTANSLKNTNKSIPEIADELGVNTFIEGALLCLGDSVCLQLKLFDQEENEIWIQDFRVERSEILGLYNTMTKDIANRINVALKPQEERLLSESRSVDKEVYDLYMKAQSYYVKFNRESLDKAMGYLNSAIEKDPDWAPLYAGLARVWLGKQQMGFEPPSVASPEIYENLSKALELDPDLPDAHNSYGLIAHVMEWDWEKSEREYLKAIGINPSDANSRVLYAQLLSILHRTDEALIQGQLALKLDPLNPVNKSLYAAIPLWAGDCKTALTLEEEVLAAVPDSYLAYAGIKIAGSLCGEYDRSMEAERYFLRMYQVQEEDIQEIDRIYSEQGVEKAYEKIMKHLEEVSKYRPISPFDMAISYMIGNQPDKALDWLEKGFELHDPAMTYITAGQTFAPLFDNPRFLDIVEKMNLPLP